VNVRAKIALFGPPPGRPGGTVDRLGGLSTRAVTPPRHSRPRTAPDSPLGSFCLAKFHLRVSTVNVPSKVLPQSLAERMADLAFDRFRPVLDFGKQRRFDPYATVRDLPGVLGLSDQRREPGPQIPGGGAVEAMVDLAGIDQVFCLSAARYRSCRTRFPSRRSRRLAASLCFCWRSPPA
jgi:hypothetical protein